MLRAARKNFLRSCTILILCSLFCGFANGQATSGYSVPNSCGNLSCFIGPGTSTTVAGSVVPWAGGRISVSANAATYIYLDSTGALGTATNTTGLSSPSTCDTGFPAGTFPIAKTTADFSHVQTVVDCRTTYFMGSTTNPQLVLMNSPNCTTANSFAELDTTHTDSSGNATAQTASLSSAKVIGVVVAGAGCSGNVTIATSLSAQVLADNQTHVGDWVSASATVAGEADDYGSTKVSTVQTVGLVAKANTGAGTLTAIVIGTGDQLSGANNNGTVNNSGTSGAVGYYAATGTVISPDSCTTGSGNMTCNSYTASGTGTGVVTFLNGAAPTAPASGKASTYVDSTTTNLTCLLNVGNCGFTGSTLRLPGATSDYFKWSVSATNGELIGASSTGGSTLNFCGQSGQFSINRDCVSGAIGATNLVALVLNPQSTTETKLDVYNNGSGYLGTPVKIHGTDLTFPTNLFVKQYEGGATYNADQFSGATADVVLNACLTAATGGTCDARGLFSTQTVAATVNIPASTTLLLGNANYSCTITNSTACFSVATHGSIIGIGGGLTSAGNATTVSVPGTANISAELTNADHSGAQNDMRVENVTWIGAAAATIPQMWDIQAIFDPAVFNHNTVECFPSIGIHLRNNTSAGFGPVSFYGNTVNGTAGCATTSNRPIVAESVASGGFFSFGWYGGGIEHAGTNQALVELNGQGVANALAGIYLCPNYIETANTGNTGFKIRDASEVEICGLRSGGVTAADFVNISESSTAFTNNILVGPIGNAIQNWSNVFTNVVNNTITGTALTTIFRNKYMYVSQEIANPQNPSHLPVLDCDPYCWFNSDNQPYTKLTGFVDAGNKVFVASDFTLAANTSLQTITGLTWTLPANIAVNASFHCSLNYSQATANVGIAFGIQGATVTPTNINANGTLYTSTTASTTGTLNGLVTTTATNIVTATPSATATVFKTELDGTIEEPSNVSQPVVNIMASTSNSGDLVTVKRGSYCTLF